MPLLQAFRRHRHLDKSFKKQTASPQLRLVGAEASLTATADHKCHTSATPSELRWHTTPIHRMSTEIQKPSISKNADRV